MRTRITRIALMSTLIAASLTTIACSPDATSPTQSSVSESPVLARQAQSLHDQYAWMGKYHNDALAFALTRIKASRKLAKYDRCKVGIAALKDFQKMYRKAGGPAIFDDLTIVDGMCEEVFATGNQIAASRGISVDGLTTNAIISTTANNYMNQIVDQIDYATSVPALSFAVARIENQASATLDGLEAGAVAGTGSITVSSADYWTANASSWTETDQLQYSRSGESGAGGASGMTAIPGRIYKISATTKRIIRADAMAALGVLVYDWWMGEAAFGKAAIKAAAASLIAGLLAT